MRPDAPIAAPDVTYTVVSADGEVAAKGHAYLMNAAQAAILAAHRAALRSTAVLLALGTLFAVASIFFLLHASEPAPGADLAALLQQNPGDYAMSMGHFLDLNAQALSLFRLPLALAAASLFLGPLASYLLRKRARPHAATLALAAGAFGFLLAAHLGLQTFAPVLSSAELAEAIAPQVHPDDLIVIHQEYEYGSTLGFYLQRPSYHSPDCSAMPSKIWPSGCRTDANPRVERVPTARSAPHPHRRQLQRHRQLRTQLQPLVRQLLP